MSVLKQRVATGVVLMGAFLAAVIWLPLPALGITFSVVAFAGAWEWAALAGWGSRPARTLYCAVLGCLLLLLWWQCFHISDPSRDQVQPWLGVACLMWCLAMLLVEQYPRATWAWRHPWIRSLTGWSVLAATWLSVLFLRTLPDGAVLLILMVVLVVAADVGAYFTGKQWGRHKLAPDVSPGKTWEGLWGGLALVMVVAMAVWAMLPPHYADLRPEAVLFLGLAVAGASILGDLTVSMIKRQVGVKDSGSLLPGHGGVLDRLDSICGAAPVFSLGLLLLDF